MIPPLALLPSPLLGPSVWQPVARVLADRDWPSVTCAAGTRVTSGQDVLDSFLASMPLGQDVVLVPHSNAGAYVPILVAQHRVVGSIFVDAVLPPRRGDVPLAPPNLLDALRELVDDAGLLPPWTSWWGEVDVGDLFPDADVRARVEREQRQLPMSYFEASLPVPQGWDERPAGYLAFGDTYAAERDEAARRGWPVTSLPGGHLHMLIDPDQVATELVALVRQLGLTSP